VPGPRRLRVAVGVFAALLLLAVLIGATLITERMRRAAADSASATVQRVARVAESALNRHFLSVDGTLAGLPAMMASVAKDGRLEAPAANRLLQELNFQNFHFRDLLLLRPDGSTWAAALPASRDRPSPLPPAGAPPAPGAPSPRGAVSINGPVRNPLTGEWALFFGRAVEAPGVGELTALAEVSVPLLATLLGSAGDQAGLRISVETADGVLLAAMPHDEARMGERLSRADAAAAMPTDGSAFTMLDRFSGEPVVASARATLYSDVVVVASYDTNAAFAEWAKDQHRVQFTAAAAALLLAALALALLAALRQREKIESERARARQVLENAIESMSDGFVMFDADDRLVICNRRYRELYGVSAPFIRPGALFEDIIREGAKRGQYPQAGADIEGFVREVTAWHRGDHAPMERLLPDGRWLLVTERRTGDGGTVGIRTDITALKTALTDASAARDAARSATEAKSRFLAHMSHELRTPLNGVLGLAQALATDPALPPAQRERARTLEAAGRHLVAVANDVLDLAKIEAGRFELRPMRLALPALLRECADWVRASAASKLVSLEVSLAPDLPPLVVADGIRIRQLVLNFLSNAVKFAPPGGQVALRAAVAAPGAAAAADGRAPVRIEVRDDGPGVPEALRAEVFGDFVQLGDRPDGTGLGLAIAAHIAARMGGRIGCDANAEAPDGRGALFWTELPLEPVAAAPAAPAGRAAGASGGGGRGRGGDRARRKLRVLVADDVPANLAVVRALLESAGHDVSCVRSGQDAVATVAASPDPPFDAVLMDVMMPGLDGREATKRIRALPGAAAKVPVLAVTAGAFPEDIAACRAAGMNAHLPKPIERSALLAALDKLVAAPAVAAPADAAHASAAPSGGGATAAAAASPLGALPLLARGAAAMIVVPGLDQRASLALAGEFLEEIKAASALLEDVPDREVAAFAPAAHRLAGAAATLGAERLAWAARRLQTAAQQATAAAERRTGVATPGAGGGSDGDPAALRREVLGIAAETIAALRTALAERSGDRLNPALV
jgi:signal transduction histidine kinase/DNA-binding NarL/FixJ family response regulator/HPt (histidine-containing phosphotransfer) domain-containing protein